MKPLTASIARWVLNSTHPIKRSLSKPRSQNAVEFSSAAPIVSERAILGIGFLTVARVKRLIKFGLVGVSGVFVNLVVFELLFRLASFPFSLANAGGIALSVFTNFLLNDAWTWGDRKKGARRRDWLRRVSKYYISAAAAAGVQLTIAWAVNRALHTPIQLDIPTIFSASAEDRK